MYILVMLFMNSNGTINVSSLEFKNEKSCFQAAATLRNKYIDKDIDLRFITSFNCVKK